MNSSSKKPLNQFEIIDFHVHVFPRLPWPENIDSLRHKVTNWLRPISQLQQEAQTWLRKLPQTLRPISDELAIPLVLPHLLIESDIFDLQKEMETEKVRKAVLIPHPPMISNDFIFYESNRIEGVIPAAFIDPKTMKSANDLDAFYQRGIRLFKVNPLQSGVPAEAPYYKEFLSYLNQKQCGLLLHTGALASHFFKLPNSGAIQEYESWIRDYPNIKFIAAHMNFHEPLKAISLAKKFENLFLLTSWQPEAALKTAIESIGCDRLLFASDWPLLGQNISVQKKRLYSLHQQGILSELELESIFSSNAEQLLSVLAP